MIRLAVVAMIVLACARGAQATPITFEFTGTVDGASGGSLVGVFTFESTTPNLGVTLPGTGIYDDAITHLSLTVAGASYGLQTGGGRQLFVMDNGVLADQYRLTASVVGPPGAASFQITLADATRVALSTGGALPLTPPDLSQFPTHTWSLGAGPSGTLTSLKLATAVPEPGTLLLLGAGLAGMAGVTWRSARRVV